MQGWQDRLIEEQRELRIKYEKLHSFINSPTLDKVSQRVVDQLLRQHYAMRLYDEVLRERISDFVES